LQLLSDGDIVVIDFEYGMPTSRGFDLANYLSEFCSDYDSATPELVNKSQFPSVKDIDQILTLYSSSCDAEKIESLRKEVLAHLPLVYLHWGHWGLVKAAESGGKSSFDYLTYSLQRYQQYIDFKTLLSPYINEKQ
jgi:thiamine kinase-like enzyme